MLLKNTIRKIKKSFGRYISIFLIIFVGIGFYVGVSASPNSIWTGANNYYKKYNLMDFKVVSFTGFSDDDIKELENINGVKLVSPTYSIDGISNAQVTRIHALESDVNTPVMVDGRQPDPNTLGEVLADAKTHNVGDKIIIEEDTKGLKTNTLRVVGTIESPLYTADNFGSSSVGNGKLESFVFAPTQLFDLDNYTEVYILLNSNKGDAYTDEYKNTIKNVKKSIEDSSPEMPAWIIFDRDSDVAYAGLGDDIDIVRTISNVVPLFFIALVALMTSTAMGRMISEERGEMGVLASIGYSNKKIIGAYLFYVLSATILGVTLGFVVGSLFIPQLIFGAFPYRLPDVQPYFSLITLGLVLLVSCLLMSFIAIQAGKNELRQAPSQLLRPLAPKAGKRVLLERTPFIWSRLSFNWKVTMRNIFRYKKRVFMTVIGIASSTSLLLLGFGIQDSVSGIGNIQYNDIFTYDTQVILKNKVTSLSNDDLKLLKDEGVEDPLLINQSSYDVLGPDDTTLQAYVITPKDSAKFKKYYNLTSAKTGDPLSLAQENVIITHKIAKVLNKKAGDTITIQEGNDKHQLKVGAIALNHLDNYIYVNEATYKKEISQDLTFNTFVANISKNKDPNAVSEALIKNGLAVNVVNSTDAKKEIETTIKGLDNIVLLIIVIAATLSLVVLYNLTSINISERTREIATLKVLGFTDKENSQYIYRESSVLTVIAIIFGLGLGVIVHHFIIPIIENNRLELIKTIQFKSFIYTFLLSILFMIIVQIFTYYNLKKIDMIGALKSSE